MLEGLHATVHLGIEEFSDHAKVVAQTNAVLKSTHGIANVTAKQIDALGLSLSNLSGIDDEVIQAGENVLLSFTNIRDFAGKNNDIFTRATKIMADFSARTGRDAPAAAVLLGKALEDPAKRVGILARAGIVLSTAQVKTLKAVENTKGILAAQKILLEQLTLRFGGAAAAAGKTLPGALNILKDRFKDLVGEGIGKIAPALTRATVGLSAFVVKLTEAQGFHAKLNVVVGGLEGIGKSIENQVKRIDVRGIAAAVGERLRSINWPQAIATAGHAVGAALAASLNKIADVIRSVNWARVGQAIVDELALTLGGVIKFLVSVDWVSVARAVVRLLAASFKAVAQVLVGVGKEIGSLVLKGIHAGLAAGGNALERLAIRIALAIIEPFSHIPKFLGGGWAQDLKKNLELAMAGLQKPAADGGAAAGQAMASAFSAKLSGLDQGSAPAASASTLPGATNLPPAPGPPVIKRKGITASQRNTFFDNAISRALLREGLLTDLKAQLGALNAVSGMLAARLTKTKDVTRRLNLEDQILQIASQEQGLRQQIGQQFLDSLSFGVTKAQATSGLKDDLAAYSALQAGIQQRIKAEGKTADLTSQLFDVRQQIKATRQQQTDARQFFTLGLDPTGGARVPLVKTLQKQLANVSNAVAGTFLDTNKTRSVLANIKKVLSAGIGNVSTAVRSQIQQMLDGIDQQLKDHKGPLTKTTVLDSSRILAGLGLGPDLERALRARLSHFNSAGIALKGSGSGSAINLAKSPIVVQPQDVYLDGKKVTSTISGHQAKTRQRNPSQRRGPNAGLAFT